MLAFGPVVNGQPKPLNNNQGELTYSKPDKGSFKITEIKTYKEQPAPAGKPARQQVRAIGCYSPTRSASTGCATENLSTNFASDQKQVIERPLPPRAPGESIIDGPLPFLFGAETAKLKRRYWMKLDEATT